PGRERETFLTALARLPRTLSHLDRFKLNLFVTHRAGGCDETVAVDWSFLARGCGLLSSAGRESPSNRRQVSRTAFTCSGSRVIWSTLPSVTSRLVVLHWKLLLNLIP